MAEITSKVTYKLVIDPGTKIQDGPGFDVVGQISVLITPGKRSYNVDYGNELVRVQLAALEECGLIKIFPPLPTAEKPKEENKSVSESKKKSKRSRKRNG